MLTNTMLSWIMIGPKYYKKQVSLMGLDKVSEESYLIFGNAVHCKLLEPSEFNNRYYIQKYTPPSNAIQKKFCSILISHNKSTAASLSMAYKMSYSVAKMEDELIEKKSKALYLLFKDYVIQEQSNTKKIGISKTDIARILTIENNVKLHKRAHKLMSMKSSKYIIVENEKVIKWEYEFPMKSKLDKFIIDFKKKKIILIDVKTHSSMKENVRFTDSFSKSFWFYSYDKQLFMYTAALVYYFIKTFGKDYDINDFTMEQKIIAIQSNYGHDVKVFNIEDDLMNRGEAKFHKAIEAYKYYQENGYSYDILADKNHEEEINHERIY